VGNNHGGKGTRKTCISCRRSGRGVQYHRSNRCPHLAENWGEDGVPFPEDGVPFVDEEALTEAADEALTEAADEAKKEATEEAKKEATEASAAAREAERVADLAEAAAVHADTQVSLPCPNECIRFHPPCMHTPSCTMHTFAPSA